MKTTSILPLCLTASVALLAAACQKPASQTATDATAVAAAAPASAAEPGGAISPAKSNGAINTDANKTNADAAAASNSFTEGEAKGHIENAGYTDVTDLQKTKDGLWVAMAKQGGKAVNVKVDFKGAVTAN
ncbi:MAG TPA: hypothetical protein VGH86_04840 [Phenylobacterium sp.]